MYIKRAVEDSVKNIIETFPVLLVIGPRQVGKSTMLEKLSEEIPGKDRKRTIVTLDDPEIRFLAQNDPGLFMQRYTPPLLIDEIQYAPQLLPYIKMHVDKSGRNGDFWLTGSQAFHMMKNISESLAGRVGMVDLLGFSDNEIHKTPSVPFVTDPNELKVRLDVTKKMELNEIYQRIFMGSMPRLYTEQNLDREKYYRGYVNTYLQRDIRDLTQVADEMKFYNFMTVVAARTGKPVIYEEIASEVGISAPTAKEWMSVLVSSKIVALVQQYHNNALKRITKMPLVHFLDTGLCAYLLKWKDSETLETGAMSGPFFESFVYSEIHKSYINAGKEPPLYYYRDKDKKEIDLILLEGDTVYPIEIKKSASPGKSAIKNFHILKSSGIEVGAGSVICMASDLLPVDAENWYVPVWLI